MPRENPVAKGRDVEAFFRAVFTVAEGTDLPDYEESCLLFAARFPHPAGAFMQARSGKGHDPPGGGPELHFLCQYVLFLYLDIIARTSCGQGVSDAPVRAAPDNGRRRGRARPPFLGMAARPPNLL